MEAHVAARKIKLLKMVEYGASTIAPYILGNSQITVHSSGATQYSAGSMGSRLSTFQITTSSGFIMDLKSLVLMATIHNLHLKPEIGPDNTQVQFLAPSLSKLLESARVTIGGWGSPHATLSLEPNMS
jgi:hypothetical protein